MWKFDSPIGSLIIRKYQGAFYLMYKNLFYGPYYDPEAAASDVYTFTTGFYEWYRLDMKVDPPHDLSEWELL